MDNKDLINLFFQVITIIVSVLSCGITLWIFGAKRMEKHFADQREDFEKHKIETSLKINRVYERMTEKCNELVPNNLYQLELKHQKENMDSRFATLMEFFKLKFEGLEKTLDKLVKHDEEKII